MYSFASSNSDVANVGSDPIIPTNNALRTTLSLLMMALSYVDVGLKYPALPFNRFLLNHHLLLHL